MFRYLRVLLFAASVTLLYIFWEWGAASVLVDSIHAPVSVSAVLVGKPAPEIYVNKSKVGSKQDFLLADLKGHPVVVHFWATWCAPCVQELPELLERSKKLRGEGVRVVAIAVDESWAKLESFFARYPGLSGMKDHVELILDPQGEIAAKFGSSRFPESFLINDQGVIDNKLVGPQPWNSPGLDPYLKRLKH